MPHYHATLSQFRTVTHSVDALFFWECACVRRAAVCTYDARVIERSASGVGFGPWRMSEVVTSYSVAHAHHVRLLPFRLSSSSFACRRIQVRIPVGHSLLQAELLSSNALCTYSQFAESNQSRKKSGAHSCGS